MSSFVSSGDWPENFKQLKTIDDLLRCPICYEYFDITMIIPQCSHNYCSLCIRRYLNYKTQCPTCGTSVSEPELRNNRGIDDLVRQFLDVRPRLLQCVKSGVNNHTTDTTDRGSTSAPAPSKPDASIFQHVSAAKTTKSSKPVTTGVKKSPPTNTLDRFCSAAGTRTFPVEDDNSDDFQDDVKRKRNKRISYKESSSDDDVEIVGTVVTPPPVKAVKVPSPKASTSSESTSAVDRNSSQVATADCPVCGVSIPERHINTHLDVCLTREEKKESLRSSAPKRKPMAKLVYNLMSDKDLRKRLKEKGLSTQGDRQALIGRHHEFVLRYNSQCDSADPKSVAQIVKEVEKHERVLNKSTGTKPAFPVKKTSNEEERDRVNTKYATEHKAQFNSLIENAKKRMKQKREAKLAGEVQQNAGEEKLPSMEVDLDVAAEEPSIEKPSDVSMETEPTVQDNLTEQKAKQASTEEDQEATVGTEDIKEHIEDKVEDQTLDAPQFNLLADFDDMDEKEDTFCPDDTRDDLEDDCASEKSICLFDNIQQETHSDEPEEEQLTESKNAIEPVKDTESDDDDTALTPSLEFGASEGSVDILAMKPYQLQNPIDAQSSSSGPSSIIDFDFLGDDPEIKCVPDSPPARQLRRAKRKMAELQSDSDGSFGGEQDVRRSKRRTTTRKDNR
ncbi:E3 ubiquitin-protein ligase RAD18-like isoform X1 [Branchiostoma lanceolatum]|uniref:E3 ubiquitin-protein ligase RAD18-like isoform X1 n=1 Tax=Branchiostoma lanceolatum TaxID=7740 RepID=UPI0034543410